MSDVARSSIESHSTQIAGFIFETYQGQYVAISNDRQSVLASGTTGRELMEKMHQAGYDPRAYFIKRIHPRGTKLVL